MGLAYLARMEGDTRCFLLGLSHDELGVIVDGLADPLQPIVVVALTSTCKGLRTPPVLQTVRLILVQRHLRAVNLCHKLKTSCAELREQDDLSTDSFGAGFDLSTDGGMETLGMILRTQGLPALRRLSLSEDECDAADMPALCEGLRGGGVPSLTDLEISGCMSSLLDPAGSEALAGALSKGAVPKLEYLDLSNNHGIGSDGVTALVPVLRQLPALRRLGLDGCSIGNEGVASLVADLGNDDFKALEDLDLGWDGITDAGCATLVSAINNGALPRLRNLSLAHNYDASDEAHMAVKEALEARGLVVHRFELWSTA